MIDFKMPSLGADMEAGTLIRWMVKPGDIIKRGDIIAEVDTQKGLIEIEVFDDGIIEKLIVKEDEKVPVGIVMALIKQKDKDVATKNDTITIPEIQPTEEKITDKKIVPQTNQTVKATPLARKMAEDNGIDINVVIGTGDDDAITKEDIEKIILSKNNSVTGKTNSTLDSIRMAVAAAMSKSNREIPHYYLETSIDMSKSIAWIKEENKNRSVEKRLLLVALLIKAVAKALLEVPELNAYWENGLVIKKEINIGFIVSLRKGGLMIPSILNANTKSIYEIMDALNDIIPRARVLKLRSSEISNSTVTVTNIGDGGADKVFGVIYPPQVSIIGFGNVSEKPFVENEKIEIRPLMSVTLAGDHRATDGNTGSKFLMLLKGFLQKPETL